MMNPERSNQWHYTYVLQSAKDGKHYAGYTANLRKRLADHNDGRSPWTKSRGPFELIYCEMCKNASDARSRELYLKSGRGKRYLKARLRRFLLRTG